MHRGDVIKKRRREKNWSQKRLAHAVRVSKSYVSKIEKVGSQNNELLWKFIRALDIPPNELLGEESAMTVRESAREVYRQSSTGPISETGAERLKMFAEYFQRIPDDRLGLVRDILEVIIRWEGK